MPLRRQARADSPKAISFVVFKDQASAAAAAKVAATFDGWRTKAFEIRPRRAGNGRAA